MASLERNRALQVLGCGAAVLVGVLLIVVLTIVVWVVDRRSIRTSATPTRFCDTAAIARYDRKMLDATSAADVDRATTRERDSLSDCIFYNHPATPQRARYADQLARALLFGYAHGSHRVDFLQFARMAIETELVRHDADPKTADSLQQELQTVNEKLRAPWLPL